jgi:hypothetical protein
MFANFVTESFIVMILFSNPTQGNKKKKSDVTYREKRKSLHNIVSFFQRTEGKRYSADIRKEVKKGKVHHCTGTEALYRPYGP